MGYSTRMFFRRRKKRPVHEIAPEDIFLDSSNLPGLDAAQFEGRVERPLSNGAMLAVGIVFVLVACGYTARAFDLQLLDGETYAEMSRNNSIERSIIFASRGVIYDRTGTELAWNTPDEATTSPFARRAYYSGSGLAHILGFVQYPKADASGNWWREDYIGVTGAERSLDEALKGKNGEELIETDVHGETIRSNIVTPPQNGSDIKLSIDAEVQHKLYETLSAHAARQRFQGGAAVIMDVRTGELIALTSFPEYDNNAFARGDQEAVQAANTSARLPLLNRAVAGLYTPGSIVKPIFAAAALSEGIIAPEKELLSKGALVLPNPYNPDQPSVFKDWRAHGWVDMRTAIAVSSDEYFYIVGGGFGGQQGLGISRLDEYARLFGLGSTTGIILGGEEAGVIPTPEWKEKVFGTDDPWRIGNTYHTAIGQFGFQITPLQAVRFAAAIANDGKLLKPLIVKGAQPAYAEPLLSSDTLQVVRDGMRLAVTSTRSDATAKSLAMGGIQFGAKTGTAEVGARKEWINSWAIGFWPYDNPRYAFAVVLEKAPAGTLSGAAPGVRPFFEWLSVYKPEYADGSAE